MPVLVGVVVVVVVGVVVGVVIPVSVGVVEVVVVGEEVIVVVPVDVCVVVGVDVRVVVRVVVRVDVAVFVPVNVAVDVGVDVGVVVAVVVRDDVGVVVVVGVEVLEVVAVVVAVVVVVGDVVLVVVGVVTSQFWNPPAVKASIIAFNVAAVVAQSVPSCMNVLNAQLTSSPVPSGPRNSRIAPLSVATDEVHCPVEAPTISWVPGCDTVSQTTSPTVNPTGLHTPRIWLSTPACTSQF